ncbi:MAG: CocE/NonD family hydrolase [Actinomycetota bacterium]|nr:MAG: CocE/NonD family hydrolase [Actinomycetota bacterium]
MSFEEYRGAMFSPNWKSSERKYGYTVDRDVKILMPDGVSLSADIWRPDTGEECPAILSFHCYHQEGQTGPMKPAAHSGVNRLSTSSERTNGSLESGDPVFFARRGYTHVVCNARGTGKSEGEWHFSGPQEQRDCAEVIEWIAAQPWCNGEVGMFGISYLAWIQLFVATLNPPHLKTIFCPWGTTDLYRDLVYRGGMFAYKWPIGWSQTSLTYSKARPFNYSKAKMGAEGYRSAISALLENDDIKAAPDLVAILRDPENGINPFVVDLALHPTYDEYWQERTVDYSKIRIPAYIGGDWAAYGIHLAAAFRSWENLDVPKRMIIAPPVYLDRPLGQLQHEAVRWFDHWLKGIDSGIMEESPVRTFVMNTGEWKHGSSWPFPETKFTPFYLHEDGLLSEHEHWPYEGSDSYEDSPWMRTSLTYVTPAFVEDTEVVGPISLKLYAATTDTDINWIVSLLEVDAGGTERILTKGWLKGSHRELDAQKSSPWEPVHKHSRSEPLVEGEIYEFDIKLVPTGNLFKSGSRLGLKISSADGQPKTPLERIGTGTLPRTSVSRVTVFHNADYPSYLLLPITKGNILGTFFSGGVPVA